MFRCVVDVGREPWHWNPFQGRHIFCRPLAGKVQDQVLANTYSRAPTSMCPRLSQRLCHRLKLQRCSKALRDAGETCAVKPMWRKISRKKQFLMSQTMLAFASTIYSNLACKNARRCSNIVHMSESPYNLSKGSLRGGKTWLSM